MAPPDAFVKTDLEVSALGSIAKPFVMVGAAPAAILYALLDIPKVDAFMQQRSGHILNGAVKSTRANIEFVPVLLAFAPAFAHGYVTVCAGRTLDSDNRFFKLACKILLIQRPEHLLQISSGAACFYCRILSL